MQMFAGIRFNGAGGKVNQTELSIRDGACGMGRTTCARPI